MVPPMEDRVLFLDVDGVLNHSESPGWRDTPFVVDPVCVGHLGCIRRRVPGLRIVLSSVWRLGQDGLDALRAAGVGWCDATPNLPGGLTDRAVEIRAWLTEHPTSRHAVLDDDADADLGDGSFFQTSFEHGGLTQAIAESVAAHLATE